MSSTSSLYLPYKVVGIVIDDSPFVVNRMGNETFLTIPIGNMLQVFRADRLTPVLVSKPTSGNIEILQAHDQDTFVVVHHTIYHYRRTRVIGTVGTHDDKIVQLQLFGELLVSCDVQNVVKVFRWKNHECISEIKILRQASITCLMHPATYLNKMVFGFDDGSIELWNIVSRKLIYSFQKHLPHISVNSSGNFAAVSAFCQSPACDVLAVGFDSGDLLMINLKLDQVVFKFHQKSKVTSISFRTDSQTSQYPFFVSASDKGHIYTWSVYPDHDSGGDAVVSRLQHSLYNAHDGAIYKVEFLHGEPVMLSSGVDNSLKMWIFDNPDGSPRLLRSRQGHKSFPKQIQYYGDVSIGAFYGTFLGSGTSGLLTVDNSGGLMYSNIGKHCHFEKFSMANIMKGGAKQLPPILAIDHSFITARSWGNLVSIHKNHGHGYVWKVDDKAVTSTVLKCSEASIIGTGATAVVVSSCGNFSVIGYSTGAMVLFNIQSGLSRGSFQSRSSDHKGDENRSICGMFIDSANTVVVAASMDGYVSFYDFKSKQLKNSLFFSSSIVKFIGCKESNLLAIADSRGVIRIVDIATAKICRIFLNGHTGRFSDLIFTLDGRRVISSSVDCTIRVWDLITGKCLSWMKFDSPISCLSLAPSGDLLVGKVGQRGIEVCFDRSLTEAVSFYSEPKSPTVVHVDGSRSYSVEEVHCEEVDEDEFKLHFHTQHSGNVGIELSTQPKSYWTSLCNMELLRKRNNIAQPVVKMATPFFLPSLVNGGRKSTTLEKDELSVTTQNMAIASTNKKGSSKRIKASKIGSSTRCVLASLLVSPSNNALEAMVYLYSLAPAKVDQEFRLLCLHDSDADGLHLLKTLLEAAFKCQHVSLNFDVIQSYVHRILTLHGSKFIASFAMRPTIVGAKEFTESAVEQLQLLLHTALCILKTSLQIQIV